MSLAVRVIPCLDVDAGRVVKGVNFVDLRDAGDPGEMARVYDAEGADELTFLDITASSGDRATTYDVVSRTAETVFIPLTVGGGVRSPEDVDRLLRAGADKVAVNTAAVVDGVVAHPGDAAAQTREALAIITAALERAGFTMNDVVRTRIYVTDISRWEEVGRAHGEVFGDVRPASTMVQVAALLDPAMLVEIEADAVRWAGA